MQALAQATDNLKGSPAYADVFGTTTAGPVRPYEQLRVCAAPKDLCRGYIHRCTRRGKDSARILRPARQNPVNGRGGTFGPRGLVGEVPCHSENLIRVRITLQRMVKHTLYQTTTVTDRFSDCSSSDRLSSSSFSVSASSASILPFKLPLVVGITHVEVELLPPPSELIMSLEGEG